MYIVNNIYHEIEVYGKSARLFSRGNNTVGLDGNLRVDGKHVLVVVGSEDSKLILEKAGSVGGTATEPSLKQQPPVTSCLLGQTGSCQHLPLFLRVPVGPGFRLQLLTDPGRLLLASSDLSTAD